MTKAPVIKSVRAQPGLTLFHPMDCSLPGFSVHGILQARILEWVPFQVGVVVGKCVHSKGARGHFGVMEILFHLDFGGNYINAHICLPKFIELYTEMGYFCCLLITF